MQTARVRQLQQLGNNSDAAPILAELIANPDVVDDPSLAAQINLLLATNLLGEGNSALLLSSRSGLNFSDPKEEDIVRACTYLDTSLEGFSRLRDARGEAAALETLASAYIKLAEYRESEKNMAKGLDYARRSSAASIKSGEATQSLLTRLSHVDVMCDVAVDARDWALLDEAAGVLSEAEGSAIRNANPAARSLIQHGRVEYNLALWERSGKLVWLEKARANAAESVKSLSPEGYSDLQAAALFDQAVVLATLADAKSQPKLYSLAVAALMDALALTDAERSPTSAATCHYYIGDILLDASHGTDVSALHRALQHFEAAERVFTRSASPMGFAAVNEGQAFAHMMLAALETPKDHLQQALARLKTAAALLPRDKYPDERQRVDAELDYAAYLTTFSDRELRQMSRDNFPWPQ